MPQLEDRMGDTLWGELQSVRPSGWNQNTEWERREALGRREFGTGHCMAQQVRLSSYPNICPHSNEN